MKTRKPTESEVNENGFNWYPYKFFINNNKWLKQTKYYAVKYKSIIEILTQTEKSNKEKYKEYIKNETIFKWLVDIKVLY